MYCHKCNTLMTEIEHDRSDLSDRVVYECPVCRHVRLHLKPGAYRIAEPDRTYTTESGSQTRRHSVWIA